MLLLGVTHSYSSCHQLQ